MIDTEVLENTPNFQFQGKPYGWWRHFRLKGPTRSDIAQLPVAHAHTQGKIPSGSCDLRSLPVAMVFVQLYYILYFYYNSSIKCTGCTCAEHTSGSDQDLFQSRDWRHFRSRDFRGRHFRGRHFRSGPLPVAPPPQMPFELCWYTTYAISAYHDWCCEFD